MKFLRHAALLVVLGLLLASGCSGVQTTHIGSPVGASREEVSMERIFFFVEGYAAWRGYHIGPGARGALERDAGEAARQIDSQEDFDRAIRVFALFVDLMIEGSYSISGYGQGHDYEIGEQNYDYAAERAIRAGFWPFIRPR